MSTEEYTDEYTTVRLPKELIEDIDKILRKGVMGYKSRAEFIKEAIREKLRTIPREILEQLSLEHFNICEEGVRVLDRNLDKPRGRIIDIYFKPENAWCEYCESTSCKHVNFALSLPEVQKILKHKGWKILKKIKET
jgi:Arc/MetJ-type ribon-helix-helix transcriptional regulator